MSRRGTRLVLGLAWALACAVPATADEVSSRDAPREPQASETAPRADPRVPEKPPDARTSVYIPPSRGTTRARAGGGTRAPSVLPWLAVLAPDHVGRTLEASPSLAWFVAEPGDVPLELTLLRDGRAEPELEVELSPAVAAGIASVSLARFGVELEVGVVYQWSLALVPDRAQRDRDFVASGSIERVEPEPSLRAQLADSSSPHRLLAQNGVWYDALSELSRRIDAGESDLRAERAAWLAQVGLVEAAAFDRGAVGAKAPESDRVAR